MPDARDHRAAAISLEHAAGAVGGVAAALATARADPGLRGGQIAPLVDRALAASHANLAHVQRCCAALVDELHRRAALCDQYNVEVQRFEERHRAWSDAMVRYERALAARQRARSPGDEPRSPTPPFAGAEAG